jgi:hypothetical protein
MLHTSDAHALYERFGFGPAVRRLAGTSDLLTWTS